METRRLVPFLLILSGFLYFVLRDQPTSSQVDEPEEALIAMVQALKGRRCFGTASMLRRRTRVAAWRVSSSSKGGPSWSVG